MTLVFSIIFGLGLGYFLGLRRKGFLIMTGVFLFALIFQSFVSPFLPGRHNIDVHDPGYWLVQPPILLLGAGLVWVGSKIRDVRARRPSPA